MAAIVLNPLFVSVRGRVGDVLVKERGGKLYMCRMPDFSRRKLTDAQEESNKRFQLAVRFARIILADPIARKPFDEKGRINGKAAYNIIILEYLTSSKLEGTQLSTSVGSLVGHSARIATAWTPEILIRSEKQSGPIPFDDLDPWKTGQTERSQSR